MFAVAVIEETKKARRVAEASSVLHPTEIRKTHRELTAQIAEERGIEPCDASNEAWPILFNKFLK